MMKRKRRDWDDFETGYYEGYDPLLEARESEIDLLLEELASCDTWAYYAGEDVDDLRLEDYALQDEYDRRRHDTDW